MAVKVLIERWVKAGHEDRVWDMLRDLRSQALRKRGHLYGETWRSLDNPRVFMVVSVWGTREHWESWVNDEFRWGMDGRINERLRKPSTTRVFEEMTKRPGTEINLRLAKEPRLWHHQPGYHCWRSRPSLKNGDLAVHSHQSWSRWLSYAPRWPSNPLQTHDAKPEEASIGVFPDMIPHKLPNHGCLLSASCPR